MEDPEHTRTDMPDGQGHSPAEHDVPSPAEEVVQRALPDDLPTSLDDRRPAPTLPVEAEIYDGWQGQSQFITTPIPAKPLSFNLGLDDNVRDDEQEISEGLFKHIGSEHSTAEDSDSRIMQMLAVQAQHRESQAAGIAASDEAILDDSTLSDSDRRSILQKSLHMAASNGDAARTEKLVSGKFRQFVDPDVPDEDGTAPLIYASCF
ncbi:hypothetical protein KEM55_004429, partial [Ascosphaera atra]